MNRDFAEMLDALSAAGADFLIVGAHALAAHGRPRATGDLDIWVRPTRENAQPVFTPEIVFQLGIAPARIDILTSLTGLKFDEAWSRRQVIEVERRALPFLSREDLIRNK